MSRPTPPTNDELVAALRHSLDATKTFEEWVARPTLPGNAAPDVVISVAKRMLADWHEANAALDKVCRRIIDRVDDMENEIDELKGDLLSEREARKTSDSESRDEGIWEGLRIARNVVDAARPEARSQVEWTAEQVVDLLDAISDRIEDRT